MAKRDPDKALDVIGKKLRIKEEIDREFDENEVISEQFEIEKPQDKTTLQSVRYSLNCKDFGLNVLANLNLGKAYKLIGEEGGEYNIPPDAKRIKYSVDDKDAMDEDWLDYIIDKVAGANNSFIILENIFTRVTTGNYEENIPYKEQLKVAYEKFSDPRLKGKFLALVRGNIEQDIIKNGGPDLMLKLGKLLGLEDRVLSNPVIEVEISNPKLKGKERRISIISVNERTTATKGIFNIMSRFEKTRPGFDIYYNTTAKQNGMSAGMTTSVNENGAVTHKPCWFLCFGPMFEYDKANLNRPSLEPYVPNKAWYKIGHSFRILNGKVEPSVRVDYEDYVYPHKTKEDFSNFTSAVIGEHIKDVLSTLEDRATDYMDRTVDATVIKARKDLGKFIKYGHEDRGEEK